MEQIIRSTSPIDANLAETLIREANAAAFKNKAIGLGAAIGMTGLALSLGAAAILWAHNQTVNPEMLKAVLASMTLKVEVKIAEGATVKLQEGSTVKIADGSLVTVKGTIPAQTQPPIILPTMKPDENPALKMSVTVFKSLPHADGEVTSGWIFASGNANSPSGQYCYYIQKTGDGSSTKVDIASDGVRLPHINEALVPDLAGGLAKCQWRQV